MQSSQHHPSWLISGYKSASTPPCSMPFSPFFFFCELFFSIVCSEYTSLIFGLHTLHLSCRFIPLTLRMRCLLSLHFTSLYFAESITGLSTYWTHTLTKSTVHNRHMIQLGAFQWRLLVHSSLDADTRHPKYWVILGAFSAEFGLIRHWTLNTTSANREIQCGETYLKSRERRLSCYMIRLGLFQRARALAQLNKENDEIWARFSQLQHSFCVCGIGML